MYWLNKTFNQICNLSIIFLKSSSEIHSWRFGIFLGFPGEFEVESDYDFGPFPDPWSEPYSNCSLPICYSFFKSSSLN